MAVPALEDVYLLRPLNEHPGSAEDKRHSKELEEFLRSKDLYESLDEALLREDVLGLFYQLVQTWVKGVCRKKNFNVEDARAHVYTFGSYRLGVHGPGTDMDTLVVGPRYVLRDTDFFGTEKHCLQYLLSQNPDITDIQPVPDAFVPMIGMKYKGVQLDILYASVAMHTLPEALDLSSHALLRGCDEATVRSLNGCRVTDTILRLVPNQEVFRLALRAAKHWASLRGISSNVTGYLGGVNLAIMVAKICQLYPRAEASTILVKFFILLKNWPWPRAIHLRVPEDHSLGLPVWDPRPGTRDSMALMPVITPAYPAMNSLYNVQRCTLEVMTGEFAAAAEVCTRFLHCTGSSKPLDWGELFAPVPFFTQHTFYIQLEVSADGDGDLVLWDGWVSSRIRRLVKNLEDHVRVRPYPKAQRPPPDPASSAKVVEDEKPVLPTVRPRLLYYIGIDKRVAAAMTAAQLLPNGQVVQLPPHAAGQAAPAGKVDLKQPCMIFVNEVSAWPAKRPGMELKVNVLRRAQLPAWLMSGPPQQLEAETPASTPELPQPVEPAAAPTAQAADMAPTKASGLVPDSEPAAAPRAVGVKRAASGDIVGNGSQQPVKRAKAAQPIGPVSEAEPAAVPLAAGGKRAASTDMVGNGSQQPVKRLKAAQGAAANRIPRAPAAAARKLPPAATAAAVEPAAATPPLEPEPAPQPTEPLSQEARCRMESQATAADEQAAVQECQLHSTGRDMGDWLGVDCGVSLASVPEAEGQS